MAHTQDFILTQPANPEYLPVIVALNNAAFDVLSWPVSSVINRLIEEINTVLYTQDEPEYLVQLRDRVRSLRNEVMVGSISRKELNQSFRRYAAWVFEGRPW